MKKILMMMKMRMNYNGGNMTIELEAVCPICNKLWTYYLEKEDLPIERDRIVCSSCSKDIEELRERNPNQMDMFQWT